MVSLEGQIGGDLRIKAYCFNGRMSMFQVG